MELVVIASIGREPVHIMAAWQHGILKTKQQAENAGYRLADNCH
jgi:hypothetical protein